MLEESISIRCTGSERALFERAAREHNRRLSDWARRTLLAAAEHPDDPLGEGPGTPSSGQELRHVSERTVVLPERQFRGPDFK